jgi:hypothetical protein
MAWNAGTSMFHASLRREFNIPGYVSIRWRLRAVVAISSRNRGSKNGLVHQSEANGECSKPQVAIAKAAVVNSDKEWLSLAARRRVAEKSKQFHPAMTIR